MSVKVFSVDEVAKHNKEGDLVRRGMRFVPLI